MPAPRTAATAPRRPRSENGGSRGETAEKKPIVRYLLQSKVVVRPGRLTMQHFLNKKMTPPPPHISQLELEGRMVCVSLIYGPRCSQGYFMRAHRRSLRGGHLRPNPDRRRETKTMERVRQENGRIGEDKSQPTKSHAHSFTAVQLSPGEGGVDSIKRGGKHYRCIISNSNKKIIVKQQKRQVDRREKNMKRKKHDLNKKRTFF